MTLSLPTAPWLCCAEQSQPHNLPIPHKAQEQTAKPPVVNQLLAEPGWAYKRDAAASKTHVYQAL